MLTLP
jgi:hypothetical protein